MEKKCGKWYEVSVFNDCYTDYIKYKIDDKYVYCVCIEEGGKDFIPDFIKFDIKLKNKKIIEKGDYDC
tara:strand:+ start:180 stop:383 length:204 start_codon:yes stop_codon:yes gene_type:complete